MTLPWYIYSILTSISFVGLYLCIRWLTGMGFAPKQILLFMVSFALPGFLGVTAPSLYDVVNSDKFLGFLAAATFAGIFSSIGHWADFEAIKRAPNPGFATSIRNSSILPVTILSVFLFDSSFHFLKLLGVFLTLAGITAVRSHDFITIPHTGPNPGIHDIFHYNLRDESRYHFTLGNINVLSLACFVTKT